MPSGGHRLGGRGVASASLSVNPCKRVSSAIGALVSIVYTFFETLVNPELHVQLRDSGRRPEVARPRPRGRFGGAGHRLGGGAARRMGRVGGGGGGGGGGGDAAPPSGMMMGGGG